MSAVRCLAFDAVGTLIYPDPPVLEVYAQVGAKYGSRQSLAVVKDRFLRGFRGEWSGSSTTSEAQERTRWQNLVSNVFDDVDDIEGCFEELFAHFGRAESWRCFPEVGPTLALLAERGLSLVIASNFDRRLRAICAGHAELHPLSEHIISSEVGFHKPAAGFYRALVDKTKFPAAEILMVGDDWENDILGAREFGLPAVYLERSAGPAERQLPMIPTIHSLHELLCVVKGKT